MDPVELQVLTGALRAICEEMGAVLIRSAHSANIKERRDAWCALFDPDGEMVMQAEHIPVHVGALPWATRAVEERLSHLDSEIAAVREQAERDSANDEVRIRQTMEEEKNKIVRAAEQEIAAAGAAAERRLRRFAAELAVDRATSRLHLTEGDDRTLIQEFASSLGSNGNQGGRN